MGGSSGELQNLTNRLKTEEGHMKRKSAQKRSRLWPDSMNDSSANISMCSPKFEDVTSFFKYLWATLYNDGTCSAEICIRIASAMARLNRIWWWNTISFTGKFKLYKSFVTFILLYGCETWTLFADAEKKDLCFQNQKPEETSPHLLLGAQDQQLGAEQDQLPYGSTGTSSCNCQEMETCMVQASHMSQQPLQNHPSGHLGEWRCRGWQRKCCMDNIKESTSLPLPEVLTMASSRKDWKRNSAESSLMFSLQPNQSRDWTEDFRCVYVEPLCSAGVVVAALGDDVEQKARQLCYRDVDLLLNNFSVTELNLTWYWSCIYFLCMNFGEVEMMSWQISVTP